MNILLISQYFPPEPGAGTGRVSYYAKLLKELGHEVMILCGIPNYSDGKIHKGYKNRLWMKEVQDGLVIYRTLVFPTSYSSSWRRFFNYLVFTISSLAVGFFLPRADVIIASSPPPSSGLTGLMLSLLKGTPLVFEVRDVWPGAAKALGYLRNRLLLNLNIFFEKRIYDRSKYIITVTEDTKNLILRYDKKLNPNKVKIITNGVDLQIFDQVKVRTRERNLVNKFVTVYAGTLGLQQGVRTLVEAIKLLQKEDSIKFLIIGDGADRHLLEEVKEEGNSKNVLLKPIQPYKNVVEYIKASNLGLTILKKNEYLDAAYPVKAFDYMAASKPVLVSGGLAMKKLIEENNLGIWVPPEDPKALASALIKMSKLSQEERDGMGKRGRRLVEKTFNRKKQAQELEKIINIIKREK
ncbi:MAG: glycosyltransferase family 4 protein [Candidatus Woykebacteria bacterium]